MRRTSDEPPGQTDPLDDLLTADWWSSLELSEQIEWNLNQVFCLLADVSGQLRTPEGRPFRWMQESIDRALRDTDRILEKLDSGAYS